MCVLGVVDTVVRVHVALVLLCTAKCSVGFRYVHALSQTAMTVSLLTIPRPYLSVGSAHAFIANAPMLLCQ